MLIQKQVPRELATGLTMLPVLNMYLSIFKGLLKTIFLLVCLIAGSVLVEHEGDHHEGLHEKSPTKTKDFVGRNVHDPAWDHGA